MKRLTVKEKAKIKKIISLERREFDSEIIALIVDQKVQDIIKKEISDDYRQRGRTIYRDLPRSIARGRRGLWDGRSAYDIKMALLEKVYTKVYDYWEQLKKILCEDFEYCKKRKNKTLATEEYDLSIAIADAIIMAQTLIPIPVTALSAYLVKKKLLDELCKCKRPSKKKK